MKEIKIQILDGYEVDVDNSTATNIVLKKIDEITCWEDLAYVDGYFIDGGSSKIASKSCSCRTSNSNKNIFKTYEQATATQALAQLSQLMAHDQYNGNWVPDWENNEIKQNITYDSGNVVKESSTGYHFFLVFKSREIRDLFLKNHIDLIRQAKPFL